MTAERKSLEVNTYNHTTLLYHTEEIVVVAMHLSDVSHLCTAVESPYAYAVTRLSVDMIEGIVHT